MALNLNFSIVEHKKDVLLDPTVNQATLERGMVMVDSGRNAAGERLVAPSAAAANERPVGFLMLSETKQTTVATLENLDVPAVAPLDVTLRELPTAVAAVRVFNTATGAAIVVVAGAPGAGQLGLIGKVLTADVALASVNFTITYRFAISDQELARRAGRRSINQGAEGIYSQVTIGYGNCSVTVSNFDVAAAFDVDTNTAASTGANGEATIGGAGTAFGTVVKEPHVLLTGLEQAFITVETNLPG